MHSWNTQEPVIDNEGVQAVSRISDSYFRFLSSLVEEVDVLDIDKRQPMVCLPNILTKTTALEYRSTSSGILAGGSSSCPEAV